VVTDVVVQGMVCPVAQVRPDGGDDERPAGCRRDFTVFVGLGSGDGRVRAASRSWSGFSCFSVGVALMGVRTALSCTLIVRAWSELRLLSQVTVGCDQVKW
jgi:hypothetical protein